MKKSIDSRVAIGVIVVLVLIATGLLWHSYAGSAVSVAHSASARSTDGESGSRARVEEMRKSHMDR